MDDLSFEAKFYLTGLGVQERFVIGFISVGIDSSGGREIAGLAARYFS